MSMTPEEILEHHGIKGMKWGVRTRGTLAGAKSKTPTARAKAKKLSDAELNAAIKRMELEKRYVDLNKQTSNAGKQYARSYLDKFSKDVASLIVTTVVAATVGNAIKNHFDSKATTNVAKSAFKGLKDNVSFT